MRLLDKNVIFNSPNMSSNIYARSLLWGSLDEVCFDFSLAFPSLNIIMLSSNLFVFTLNRSYFFYRFAIFIAILENQYHFQI